MKRRPLCYRSELLCSGNPAKEHESLPVSRTKPPPHRVCWESREPRAAPSGAISLSCPWVPDPHTLLLLSHSPLQDTKLFYKMYTCVSTQRPHQKIHVFQAPLQVFTQHHNMGGVGKVSEQTPELHFEGGKNTGNTGQTSGC